MKTIYYALFTCDEWKSHSSMALRGVFTKEHLVKQLNKLKREKSIENGSSKDFQTLMYEMYMSGSDTELNSAITYAYVQQLQINQEL